MSAERIPWYQPQVGDAEKTLVCQVLDSGHPNEGQVTRQFERRLAEVLGVPHCVAVTSGTAAIALALMACGVGQGDEVIVPDMTFIATANAVSLTGATPVLVDIERTRLTIDVAAAERAISPRTRAIVPVDVNGRSADYDALAQLCQRHNLELICDSAEAFGSRRRGTPLGTFGRAGCFSLTPAKTICTGQGGFVAVHDDVMRTRIVQMKDQGRAQGGTGGNDLHPVVGFNFKFTNIQAAIGLAQLDRLENRLRHFRERDAWYREMLADCPGVVLPPVDAAGGELLQWVDALFEDRARIEAAFTAAGIGFRPFWFPLHSQDSYRRSDSDFQVSIEVSRKGLWLPSSFFLTRSEAEEVCTVVRATLGESWV